MSIPAGKKLSSTVNPPERISRGSMAPTGGESRRASSTQANRKQQEVRRGPIPISSIVWNFSRISEVRVERLEGLWRR